MKVIFLDHDGVVCLAPEWGGRKQKIRLWNKNNPDKFIYGDYDANEIDVEYRFDNFNPGAVKVLNQILAETDAEIVVSSDWRFDCTLEEMQDLYRKYGVIKSPIDYTPVSLPADCDYYWDPFDKSEYEQTRSQEITLWLSEHPEVTNWVAVDDINMSERFDDFGNKLWGLSNFVHTKRMNEGIKQLSIKQKIIKFLI